MSDTHKRPMCHLHLHTDYSILDGSAKAEDYVEIAKEYKHPAMAITDHGNMSGTFKFFNKCKEAEIKPIIGMEAYINNNIGKFETKKEEGKNGHLIILVKNEQGYRNINKLTYKSFTEGYYRRGRITADWLFDNKEGLIVGTACIGSIFGRLMFEKKREEADKLFKRFVDEFGDDFYAELQMSKDKEQKWYNDFLIKLAKKYKVRIVLTNDVHYVKKEDNRLQDVIVAIFQKSVVKENSFMHSEELHYVSSEYFHWANKEYNYGYSEEFINECIDNTLVIANKCNFEFETNVDKYPRYEPAQEVIDYFKTDNTEEIIYKLAYAKLNQKLREYQKNGIVEVNDEVIKKYRERLEYELGVIKDKNVLDYFLVNWELIKFCEKEDIMHGVGRGSAAGSLLSYCLGITKIDPLRFNLFFERFLNPTRKCITENNDVLMKDGSYKNIMNITLEEKNNIQTKTGIGELVEIVDREVEKNEEIFKIETEDGSIVELTGNHIVPVFRREDVIEIRVDEIQHTDYLLTF